MTLDEIKAAVEKISQSNPPLYVLLVGNYQLFKLIAVAEAAKDFTGYWFGEEDGQAERYAQKIATALAELEKP